jgi:hypothetical protein
MFVIGPATDTTNRVLGSFIGAIALLTVALQIFS